MSNSPLFDSLRKIKVETASTAVQITPFRQAITALFADIERWLNPAVEEKLLTIDRSRGAQSQDEFNYEVPILALTLPNGREISFQPIGLVLGSGPGGRMGRIDVESGASLIRLLWTLDGWQIATPSGSASAWQLTPLNESTLLQQLDHLLSARPFDDSQ